MNHEIETLASGRSTRFGVDQPMKSNSLKANYFSRFKLVDLASRVVPAALFLLILGPKLRQLYALFYEQYWGEQSAVLGFLVHALSQLSTVCFLMLMTVLFFIRLEPIEKAHSILPRIMALTGTFLMAGVTLFPRADLSLAETFVASVISLVGTTLSIIALGHLGRSFSLMPEARKLVTTGPYRIVRHPLYLFEGVSTFGVLLQFLSPYTALLFIVHVVVQLTRMKNEEAVLQKAFPEYQAYKARTAKVIPKFY